ncbi:thiamine phosphate synthase [Methylomonas paludis]|uniref:Thiamine-phosphate synthase n=1 Tax=Methylomonas paludis TaxID=1173101 RepID=A0A975MQH3_9GAMM|nr:thiamine phosphate synthase [Methylomonas paludis]QWF72127.1 thiamine phosphate synthase [Methylomonas paludis]
MKFPAQGLYAITQPEGKSIPTVLAEVEAALRGGAGVLQYRDKNPLDAVDLSSRLLQLCRQYQVPLLINDNVELALVIGADGVHLGKDDGDIQQARLRLGSQAIIGTSCYNDPAKAVHMQTGGADYVAFGRFFTSGTKPLAAPAQLETLRQAKANLHIPIVAIGGILPDNGGQLLAAGADLLAVIGGLFDAEPETAAQAYLSLFKS